MTNGLKSYSVVLSVQGWSECASALGESCKRIAAEQRKENAVFLGMKSGWRTERPARFHQAVCKTAIAPERCIIAPFILKGLERSGLLANRESS